MKAVQPEECTKHHMMLKERLDKIDCLIFFFAYKPNEIPLATKVNIMFSIMIFLFVGLAGTLGTVIKISMSVGKQLNQIERMSIALDKHIEGASEQMMNYETRIIYLESYLAKKEGR